MNSPETYYKDPRFEMTIIGRTVVRVFSSIVYIILTAIALIFILSGIEWLSWSAALIALFLFEKLTRHNHSDRQIGDGKEVERINLAQYITPRANRLIYAVYDKSLLVGGNFFLQCFKNIIDEPEVRELFERLNIPIKEVEQKCETYLKETASEKNEKEDLNAKVKRLVQAAFESARQDKSPTIDISELLSGLSVLEESKIQRLLSIFNIEKEDIGKVIIFTRFRRKFQKITVPHLLSGFRHHEHKIRHRIMNRAWTARPTPTLDAVGRDITDEAHAGRAGFLIGHEKEYRRLIDILANIEKPRAILIGEPTIGKETIVEHCALEIVADKIPQELFDKRIVALDIRRLVTGANQDEIRKRVSVVCEEIVRAGNIVLYIPDMHNLVKINVDTALSLADLLLPLIEESRIQTISTTTKEGYKEFLEQRTSIPSSFEMIEVEEISEADAIKILIYQSLVIEKQYKCFITYKAIKNAVALARRYENDRPLPQSAIGLLLETVTDLRNKDEYRVTAEAVAETVERRTGIPVSGTKEGEARKLLNLEEQIHKSVIGQDEAVKAVANALREYRSGLKGKDRPIASFLFVGPTGVGKTELAKALAKNQFGSEEAMLRFDMTEYQEQKSIERLIGSPDGKTTGLLTDAVRERPYSLILLDEFEKANPELVNVFLQVFDDGRLTDSHGRTIGFENAIIIATSNAHSELIKTEIERDIPMKDITEKVKERLTDYFRPELLNRLSGIIVFKTLSRDEVKQIAKLAIVEIQEILALTQHATLEVNDVVIEKIAGWGFDPVYGARPLRRVVEEKIKNPLSEIILKGQLRNGAKINAELREEDIQLKIENQD